MTQVKTLNMINLVSNFPLLFWDVDPETLDLNTHKRFIIERVLENGTMESVHDLFGIYKEEEIIDAIVKSRNISPKTANFWRIKLDINNEIKCLQTQSQETQPKLWK